MSNPPHRPADDLPDRTARRVWIENVQPSVDGGRHPAKRVVGERVVVRADILADGHDRIAAVARVRTGDDEPPREVPLRRVENDRWEGSFEIAARRLHRFTVIAWIDRLATWQEALAVKRDAGQDVAGELIDGAALVDAVAGRAGGDDAARLREIAAVLRGDAPVSERIARALAPDLAELAARHPDRARATEHEPELRLEVARPRARTGAWYEMFPRSHGPEPGRHGTLRDAEDRIPAIAAMGFDVLYLPPIHPIGRVHRKGPDNSLTAGPGDPGSPWAIGSDEGGHTAVHPDLGTLDDLDHFVAATRAHGMELALDLALQCAPDHPWVREHPEWFVRRHDGSIRHAENPPKQYEDIVPLDFACDDWRRLWGELLATVLFWVERGVTVLRVDNPHTKPLRFWRWLIAEVRRRHPDVVFLSEAFTRPRLMYALAKVGFDQSYTYFTWRNTRRELTRYLEELTRPPVSEFFRPNLFTNTPDILPEYLQLSGRPGFQARLVLAATLSASYGIYSGFELCEDHALPGREEYAGSEKYQLVHRDYDAPGNLSPLITRINRIRRDNPALQRNDTLRFHPVDNDLLLFYSKVTEDLSSIVLVVVNLDPHHTQSGWVEVPLTLLDLSPHDSFQVHDLIGEGRYLWQGSRNYVEIDPRSMPAQVYRVRRRVRTERDFDYYM